MNKAIALLLLLLVVGCASKTVENTSDTTGTATDTSTDVLVAQSSDGLNDLDMAQQEIDDTTFDDVQSDIDNFDW